MQHGVSVYAKPLTRNFKEYSEKRDLAILEYAIDRFYYKNALRAVKGESYDDRLVREMVMTEIDVTNIKNVLKMIRDKIDAEEVTELPDRGRNIAGYRESCSPW